MVFNKFYWQLGLRVVFLTLVLILLAFCITSGYHLRAGYIAVLALILVCELSHFITRFIDNIKTFLIALQQKDFTFHFEERENDSFFSLYRELNKVTDTFKQIGHEKEEQYRFLEMLVEHIQIGLICFDSEGNIYLVNNAFREIVGQKPHTKFKFNLLDSTIIEALKSTHAGEVKSFVYLGKSYSLYGSDFKLGSANYKLISMNDVTSVLERNEQESYIKLMRVLTHEIMNSLSPIVSLSDTMHKRLVKEQQDNNSELIGKLERGMDAIRVRSEGLQQFSESYRQLSRIPQPIFQPIHLKSFFEYIEVLVLPELKERSIRLSINSEDVTLKGDKNLIEQALINLIRNAMEALVRVNNPVITISAQFSGSNVMISVSDNGEGIDEENLDKVYVPFFTTKKNGTGIGLAVVRHIIQLHHGSITINSKIQHGTTVTIII